MKLPCGVAAHGQQAGHRERVQEEDELPPVEGGSFRYFKFIKI